MSGLVQKVKETIMGDESYDYVIVGGGTAGPVVACRLAEDSNNQVLLLEAGKDSAEMDSMHMAGAWTTNHSGETDWNIITPPQEGLKGRQCHVPRGKFLGGSSGCNGTICVRGVEQDYDDWGFPEWSGKEMFRAMKKSETFHPSDWFPHDKNSHGYDGPLHIEATPTGPLGDLFFKSYQSKGLPYHPDMFSSGETSRGCGHGLRTTWQGYRTTAADFVTKDNKKKNVTIKCDSLVDKVIWDKSGGKPRAKGVEYVDKQGNRHNALAKREVILTAGTYCSPAIAMRSGLGVKKDLEALGIECLSDLPGMGKNLQDHQLIFTYYELNQPGLTDDPRVNHDPNSFENGSKEWRENKTGWLANFPFGAFAFNRLSERLDKEDSPAGKEWRSFPRKEGRDPMDLTDTQPNLEFFHTVCYGGPPEYTDKPKEGQYAFAMCCFLCGLMSRGEVLLKSKDVYDNPIVDHKYLSDRRDLIMMAEGCRFANEVCMEGAGTKDVVKGAWPPGSTHHTWKTNEDWQRHVQQYTSTSYHPGGTCKIGPDSDKTAVLDQRLRVKGVDGLRIVDCSMMPTLHSGHTQMPAYGIGEIGAELILADNK